MPSVSVILAAAGAGTRMGNVKKVLLPLGGKPVLLHSLQTLSSLPEVCDIVVVAAKDDCEEIRALTSPYGKVTAVVAGGETRQESVKHGIAACRSDTEYFAIHDAARPLVTTEDAVKVIRDAENFGAATLGAPVKDTIKQVDSAGTITGTPPRSELFLTQTPQVFRRDIYLAGLTLAAKEGKDYTDDCQLAEAAGFSVHMTCGSYRNIKLTTPEDMLEAEALLKEGTQMRVGHGYDVHKFAEGRKLILGGVEIPYTMGLLGHSDADVLTHAVMDALLGAAALGDIGQHFPDTDDAYLGADSIQLLQAVVSLIKEQGYSVGNIDATILAQSPKLMPYLPKMRENLANACGIDISCVNVKATTEEGLGFTGAKQGIAAHAVCLLQ